MLNGPCGGSDKGKCEVSPEMPCGWQLIYERLKTLGQLDRFEKPVGSQGLDYKPGRRHSQDRQRGLTDMNVTTTPSKIEKLLAARTFCRHQRGGAAAQR